MAKEVNKKENKNEEKVAKNNNSNSMRTELKKVTWPTRKELVNSTTAVIVIVIITAIVVFILDVAFESLSTYGINRLRSVVSDKLNSNVTANDEVIVDDTSNELDNSFEVSDDSVDTTNDVATDDTANTTTVETTNGTVDTTTGETDSNTDATADTTN